MPLPEANPRIEVRVLRDDGAVLAVDKDAGRVSMPGAGHARDSMQNGVMALAGDDLAALGSRRDYGLLHRLDRATSGVLLFARTAEAYAGLREAFRVREIRKDYLAITQRVPARASGVIRERLREARRQDRKIAVPDVAGAPAVTRYRVRSRGRDGVALVECRIETGRLHQVRVHLASIGAPLLGDAVYRCSPPDGRARAARSADAAILLHAWRVGFSHPETGADTLVEAPIPPRFREALGEHGLSLGASHRKRPSLQKNRRR